MLALLRTLFSRTKRTKVRPYDRSGIILLLEKLEDRITPVSISFQWRGTTSTDWGTMSNWWDMNSNTVDTLRVPGAADNVVFDNKATNNCELDTTESSKDKDILTMPPLEYRHGVRMPVTIAVATLGQ
jgi:hypothetical protein